MTHLRLPASCLRYALGGLVAVALLSAIWEGCGAKLWPQHGNPTAPPLMILGAALTDQPQFNKPWRLQPSACYVAARTLGSDVYIGYQNFAPKHDIAYAEPEYYLANLVLYPHRAWVYPATILINTGQDILRQNGPPSLTPAVPMSTVVPPDEWLLAHHIRVVVPVDHNGGATTRAYRRVDRHQTVRAR